MASIGDVLDQLASGEPVELRHEIDGPSLNQALKDNFWMLFLIFFGFAFLANLAAGLISKKL